MRRPRSELCVEIVIDVSVWVCESGILARSAPLLSTCRWHILSSAPCSTRARATRIDELVTRIWTSALRRRLEFMPRALRAGGIHAVVLWRPIEKVPSAILVTCLGCDDALALEKFTLGLRLHSQLA